ncbi:MAG: hypothetical protein APF77_20440 [Clostridia bacterium BRH_c25]|nr:MAG: hypothetical protein APF77_20440 [Clostridia bacterium BRH_c25]
MSRIKTIGFPRMHKEESEKRDFLPDLFEELAEYDIELLLEEDYGERLGYTREDYQSGNRRISFVKHDDVYKCDMVMVLRAPDEEELMLMKPDAVLISMLHYETRATRNNFLQEKGIFCYSMDAFTDDDNNRIMVNYRGTSRAGSRVAFEELKKRMTDFNEINRRTINVSIIGLGAVASFSAKAFEDFSDKEFYHKHPEVPGLIVRMLPRNITKAHDIMREILKDTDILVDASKRTDSTMIIVPNDLLEYLPKHAIILDLTADPYNTKMKPAQVKGIEGIPTGTLDKFVIEIDDPLYDDIPKDISSTNRRVVISCNAWPGVDAKDCMRIYGTQILPLLKVLLEKDPTRLSINSKNFYERSLVRASLKYYTAHKSE